MVPLIGQLRHYSARWARADIVASFATAVTLLPQGLAFGALAGLSPVAGLYTALGAATIFALLTATRFVAVGPSSTMALLTFAVVHGQAGGGDRAVALTAALSLLVGVGCLLVAVLPLQGVADFLSGPVMLGYLAGLGIQLFAGQVGTLLGFPPMASTSRTLSARSSAHSQLFQLIAAGIVAFVLFTGGPLVALLPMPVLAAILVVGAPKLIDVTGLRWLWRGWRAEGVIALVAVAGVLGLGVLRGLLIAVILSASQLIRRAARPHDSLLAIIDAGHPPQEIADGDASPHRTSSSAASTHPCSSPTPGVSDNGSWPW